MLLPDDLIIGKNCSKEMIKIHSSRKSSVIASIKVNKKDVSRWGIFKTKNKKKRTFKIIDVVEKPIVKNSPSRQAVIGRYILPRTIFSILEKQRPGKNGEIHITDAIQKLIIKGNNFIGYNFKGKYFDCGSMKGYIKSSLEISKL